MSSKSKKKPVQLNQATIKWLKEDAQKEAYNKLKTVAFNIVASAFIAAIRDEKVKDDVISKICERASRYTDYLDDGKVTFEEAWKINARYGYKVGGGKNE